jgi:cyanophycinase
MDANSHEERLMNVHNLLFLLGGGSTILDAVAEEFVPAAGGPDATIALLLAGGQGWEDHVPQYTLPWIGRGVTRCYTVVPGENGALDLDTALARLRQSTGIFIGGGDTPAYRRLYATDPIRSMIRQRYREGVPIAGFSAGALIAPQVCAIPPGDTGDSRVRIVPGLGLVSGLVVGVHFSEWNALPHMVEAMVETRTATGLGIDEAACAVLENGELERVLGQSAYKVELTDFTAKTGKVTRAT